LCEKRTAEERALEGERVGYVVVRKPNYLAAAINRGAETLSSSWYRSEVDDLVVLQPKDGMDFR
jgi:hypothetical protein